MVGTMKGHNNIHAAYSNSRRKWSSFYVVMVVVCSLFGCLILGLMGIHRLRERRSLNLIINERDDQILSLHHLLQKERGHVEEAKRKTEEMRTKMMNLGSEKADLSTRISEMQSTIASLREEQRTMESAFQEKQNEANLMREKYAQVEALTAELQRKEAEIEDLNRRLQLRSASKSQLSNATSEANAFGRNETGSGNGGVNTGDEVELKIEKEHEESGKEEQTQLQIRENQEVGVHQEWKKIEVEENPHRFRGRRGYLRRAKAKRWKSIGKHVEGMRTSPSTGASTMADQGSLNAGSNIEDGSQSQGTRNSSSETTQPSLEELAKNSAMKRDGVKQIEEIEHSEEQISIKKPIENENENENENEKQDTDLLPVRKEVSGRNGDEQDAALSTDSEESEDKEETEEPEF